MLFLKIQAYNILVKRLYHRFFLVKFGVLHTARGGIHHGYFLKRQLSFFIKVTFSEHPQIMTIQKQPPEVFFKKRVLKNFASFTGKHLRWGLHLIKCFQVLSCGICKILRTPNLKNICERLLINTYFGNLINPLSTNPTKWSNTLKQFVRIFPTNCLSVFDHFVKLAIKRSRLRNTKRTAVILFS